MLSPSPLSGRPARVPHQRKGVEFSIPNDRFLIGWFGVVRES
jgi:hypothetical protein